MLAGLWGRILGLELRRSDAAVASRGAQCHGFRTRRIFNSGSHGHPRQRSCAGGEGVHEKLQYPFAVGVGFLSHRILGPFLLRLAKKKADEVAP